MPIQATDDAGMDGVRQEFRETEMGGWHPIATVTNTIFDVFAKRWDASTDSFTMHRFAGCVLVDNDVWWQSPFHAEPMRLRDLGFCATHWMQIPVIPSEIVP